MKAHKKNKLEKVKECIFDAIENSSPDEAVLKLMSSRKVNLSERRHASFYYISQPKRSQKLQNKN